MYAENELSIIRDLEEELYLGFDEDVFGDLQELEKMFEGSIERYVDVRLGQVGSDEDEVEYRIKSFVRDKVEAAYDSLKKRIPEVLLSRTSCEEIKQLIRLLLKLRNEPFDFFYRKESDAFHGMRRLNAQLKKGDLVYNYEEFTVFMINKWNNELSHTEAYSVEDIYSREFLIEVLKSVRKRLVTAIRTRNTENVYLELIKLEELYGIIVSRIKLFEKQSVERNDLTVTFDLVKAEILLDMLLGSNRDILDAILYVTDFDKGTKVIDGYIYNIQKSLKKLHQVGETHIYSLIENYVLISIFYSLSNERREWINMQEYLIEEVENNVQPVKRPKEKLCDARKDVWQIYDWLKVHRNLPFNRTYEELESIIYEECFLYKKRPERMKRFGIGKFLKYIKDNTNKEMDNATYEELFYFEKIIRGIYRKSGALDYYKHLKKSMNKVYAAEMDVFSPNNMSGMFLGWWADVFNDAMINTIIEYSKL